MYEMNNKKIFKIIIAIIVIMAIPISHYLLNKDNVDKDEMDIKKYNTLIDMEDEDLNGTPHDLDGTNFTGEVIYLENRLEFIKNIKNFDNAISVCNGLVESTLYIDFLIEDFKSEELEKYFNANTTVLVKLYGISDFKEFEKFYNLIKDLGKLKSYEIILDTVIEKGNVYNFELVLKGDIDITLPVTAATLNSEDMIATIVMNK